jgi:hypothetical protein
MEAVVAGGVDVVMVALVGGLTRLIIMLIAIAILTSSEL